jgi:hypothetical protein
MTEVAIIPPKTVVRVVGGADLMTVLGHVRLSDGRVIYRLADGRGREAWQLFRQDDLEPVGPELPG